MKKDILLSTTASIPNYEVVESKGLVFANVVLGKNFFSDFAASITDTFGGTSDTYQSKLDKIYNEVIEKLSKKTLAIGCNAIIGFKIDFDEISGKGLSMFMVNAVGTACKAQQINSQKAVSNGILLDEEDLENAVLKYKIQMKESDNSNGGTAREMENLCRPLSRRIKYVRELSAPLKPIRGTNPSTYQPRILEKRERFSQISCFKKEKSAICTNSSIHFRA